MLYAIGDSLSDLASSDNEKKGEDEVDDKKYWKLGKFRADDEHSRVLGTISSMVKHCMLQFQQKQMRFDELKGLGYRDAADYILEGDLK